MADPTVRVPRSLSLLTSARAWRGQDLADREGRSSRRHVEPHRLVCTGRRGYLVARDLDRDDWRSSRVDAPVDVVVRRVPHGRRRGRSWTT